IRCLRRPARRGLLDLTERLDLLEFLRRKLAWSLAAGHLLVVDVVSDVVDDLGVRQRGYVPNVGEVGDAGDNPAHDLPGARLGHVRDDPDVLRSRDLPDLPLDRLEYLLLDVFARGEARLQRDVHLDGTAANLVDDWDRGGLGDLLDGDARRLELLGAQPVAGHVDHVVDPAEDAEVAVGRLDGAVAGEVGPVMPVLAPPVPAVLLVVGLHEPLRLAPDRLEDAGPGVADTDVAGAAAAGLDHIAVLVVDHRVDPEDPWAAAAGLHRLQGGQGAAKKAAILGLPPGVDDDRLALADSLVVPAPDVRLDGLADRRHVLEVVVVLLRLVGAELAQHADRRGRGVEDVHPEPLDDPPGTTGIRIVGLCQVGARGRPVRRSHRGAGRWHSGQAPAQQASRTCSCSSSCHKLRPTPLVLGDAAAPGSGSRARLRPGSRGGASQARSAPRSGPARARLCIRGHPAPLATAVWPAGPAPRSGWSRAGWPASTWSVRACPWATRPAASTQAARRRPAVPAGAG